MAYGTMLKQSYPTCVQLGTYWTTKQSKEEVVPVCHKGNCGQLGQHCDEHCPVEIQLQGESIKGLGLLSSRTSVMYRWLFRVPVVCRRWESEWNEISSPTSTLGVGLIWHSALDPSRCHSPLYLRTRIRLSWFMRLNLDSSENVIHSHFTFLWHH